MSEPRSSEGSSRGRWLALDLLRFCAAALMVQGHTFTTLLDPSYQSERWFRHHNFVHGYTAPMFLFASGLAFGFTTFRGWKQQTTAGDALWKRMRRYGWLLLIGYTLHMPALALSQLMSLPADAVVRWLQVDVLQHIGVSLAALQLLAVAVKRPERFARIVGALFLIVVFASPIVWAWDVEAYLPVGLAGYVNDAGGSLFPLFPWAGFTYAGVLVAYAARNVKSPSRELAWPIAITAALALVVPIAVNHTGFQPYGSHDFWRTSPYYFFWRLGNVMSVLALLCFAERFLDRKAWSKEGTRVSSALSTVRIVGAESLVIYVAHLIVLHGSVLSRGLVHATGQTLSFAQASIVSVVLFAAMIALAWGWHRMKRVELRFRAVQLSMTGAFAYLMLTAH